MALQSRDDLIAKLRNKKYRDAFVSSRVSNTLALQIRVMRQERGWSQAHLAKLLGTSQNAVYRLESPQYGKPSITTLKRLASIFDVGLAVWFAPFSKLVDRVMNLSTEDILVPSFHDDPGFQESVVTTGNIEITVDIANNPILAGSFRIGTNANNNFSAATNQPALISRSSTVVLSGSNTAITGGDTLVQRSDQYVFDTGVVTLFPSNPPSASVQTLGLNPEGRSHDVGKPLGTAA